MNKQKLLKRVLSAIFAVSVSMSNVAVDFSNTTITEVSANTAVNFSLDYTGTVDSKYPQIKDGVLKLENFKFTTSADAAIIVPRGTTIEFSGTNVITSNKGIGILSAYDPNVLSTSSDWGLTIEGNSKATLTINAAKQGIYVKELDLFIDDADITVTGSTGIYMVNDSNTDYKFDIKNSTLDVKGNSGCGVELKRILGTSTWSNSEINIVGKTLGLSVDGNGGNGFVDKFTIDNCDVNIEASGNSAIYLEDVNDFAVTSCDEFNLSGANNGIQAVGSKVYFKKTEGSIEGNVNGLFIIENPNDLRADKGTNFVEFDAVDLDVSGGTTAFKTDLLYGTNASEILFSNDVFPYTGSNNTKVTFDNDGTYTQMYNTYGSLVTTMSINDGSGTSTINEDTAGDGTEEEDDMFVTQDVEVSLYNISFWHNYPGDETLYSDDDFIRTTDDEGYLSKTDLYSPTYDGYTFLGWYTASAADSGIKVTENYQFTSSIDIIYGKWEEIIPAKDAKITFNANGGSISTASSTLSTTVLYTDDAGKISMLPNVTKDGYTFLGWYNVDTKVTTSTPFDGDTTVYAQWQKTLYITFDYDYDGQETVKKAIGSDNLVIGGFPTVDNRPNLQFLGWYTEAGNKVEESAGYDFDESQTLTAKWTASYTISFDPVLSLLEPPTQSTDAAGKLTSLPKMICPGYGLLGWYTDEEDGDEITVNTIFTEDTTIYARWVADEFTITFKPDYTGSVEFTKATTNYKIETLPEAPSRSGYAFEGWYTKQNGAGTKVTDGYEFEEDTIVYGLWADSDQLYNDNYSGSGFEEETGVVTITLDGQHSSYDNLESLTTNDYGRLTKYPGILMANGLAFDGWYTGKDGAGEKVYEDTKFLNDTTIYANWIEGEITVTINQDYSGSFEIPYATTNNRLSTLPTPKVRPGYTFEGWYWVSNSGGSTDATIRDMSINLFDIIKSTTSSTIDSAVTTSTVFTTDATIYASWSSIEGGTIIVSFDSNGGTPGYYIDQTGVDGRLSSLPTPTRDGYTFLGWYDGNLEISTSYIFRFDTEVYAKWQLESEYEAEQGGNPGYAGSVMYTRDIPTLERLYVDKFQNLVVGDYITGLGTVSPNRPDLGTFVGWYHGADLSRPLDYFELQSILVTEELFQTGIYPKFEKNIVSTGGSTSSGGNYTTQVPVTGTSGLTQLF